MAHLELNPPLVDCTNTSAMFDESCWQTLDIPGYLGNSTGWAWTMPKCDTSSSASYNGIGCCYPDEAWSTCYLRYGWNGPGTNCTTINDKQCVWPSNAWGNFSPNLNSWQLPRSRYVLWNIYQINNLFNTYYTALQYAVNDVQGMITSLTTHIDLIKKPSVTMMDLLSALTLGLVFLSVPAIFDIIPTLVAKELVTTAQAFTLGLQYTPGTIRALWPQGDAASQTLQIGELNDHLDAVNNQTSAMLNNGLQSLMTDVSSFITFAGYGRYSGAVEMSVPAETNTIAYALRTYLTSLSMKENSWYAWTNGTFDLGRSSHWTCRPYPNNANFCDGPDTVWTSPKTGRKFYIRQKGKRKSTGRQLMNEIMAQGWADIETLFEGAYNCTASFLSLGKAGSSIVNMDPANGIINMDCISQLPIYVPEKFCPPESVMMPDGSCPFGSPTDTYVPSCPAIRNQPACDYAAN